MTATTGTPQSAHANDVAPLTASELVNEASTWSMAMTPPMAPRDGHSLVKIACW